MGGVLSNLRRNAETQLIYKFFRKCFIILRNPPLKPDIKQTKKLLLTVADEKDLSQEFLEEFNNLLSVRKNYDNFAACPFITALHKTFVNSKSNPENLTIGHMAALENDTFFMGKLVTYNILPDFPCVTDSSGKTPLHRASETRHTKITDLLLNTNVETIERLVDFPDNNGWTALHLAAKNNMTVIASKLTSKGADIDMKNLIGFKPIHIALYKKLTPMVEFLQSEGADINEPVCGYPLIALAYEIEDTQLVNYLVNLGLDISALYDGTTFIHTICNDKNSKLLRKVIQKYDVYVEKESDDDQEPVAVNIFDQEDSLGRTPFDIACSKKFYSAMKLLARCDADVDHMVGGNTALHRACAASDLKTAKVLLGLNADPTILNADGLNCREIAETTGNAKLLELVNINMPIEIDEIIVEVEPFSDIKVPVDIIGDELALSVEA